MRPTDSFFFDQLEPMSGRTVQRFALTWDERWYNLIKHRYLICKSKLEDIGVVRGPYLLDLTLIEHFSHAFNSC